MFTPTRAVQRRVSERRTSESSGFIKSLTAQATTPRLSPTRSIILLAETQGAIQGSAQTFYHEIFSLRPIAFFVVHEAG